MGRFPSRHNEISGVKKGPWTPEEDKKLVDYISEHGHGCWRSLPKLSGLNRCGKSCRLRWTNYLRPDIKRGKFSEEEETTIINLHSALGNKWSKIANSLPGRTDNEIKNYWNTYLRKKLLQMGIDPNTHKPRTDLNNQLLNLSHLLNSSRFTNFIMNNNNALNLHAQQTTDQFLKIQLLQNLFQVINYCASPNSTNNTASSVHLLGAQNISNPFQDTSFASRYDGLDYSTNYPTRGLQGIINDHQDAIINPLPKLVSEPLLVSSGDNGFGNQIVEKNDDQSNNNSTTFENWELYTEDNGETSETYWKDILQLMSDSPILL